MKKSYRLVIPSLILFLVATACSKNDDMFSLEGTWVVTSIRYDNAYDFDYDGNETADFQQEYPCTYYEEFTLNTDGTGELYVKSPITWVIAPYLGYECSNEFEVSRDFMWEFNSENNELTNRLTVNEAIYTYELQQNKLIYKIVTNTVRQTYIGNETARDTLRFVFEKVF